MKKYNGFLPRHAAQKAVWGLNFSSTLEGLATTLGFTTDEIASVKTASKKFSDQVNTVQEKNTALAEATSTRDELGGTFETLARSMANRVKTHPAYTDSMGRNLGIVNEGQEVDKETVRPSLKPEPFRGYVSVKFNKRRMVGVTIYSRIKGTNGWEKIANATQSPYLDKRPLAEADKAETREYMALCYDGATDIGKQSAIETVVYGG